MSLLAKYSISTRGTDGKLITFSPGELIEGLSEKDEKYLIERGAAEKVQFVKTDGNKPPIDYAKLLDEEFTATELKEAAKETGMEFAGNISKENLIKQIVEEGRAEEFIEIEGE